MLVNLQLTESGTWIRLRKSRITDTLVKGAALDIELTDGIKDIVKKFDGMVQIVPINQEVDNTGG